jgi:hypothetical protein
VTGERGALLSEPEAIYAALSARYGIVVRGDLSAFTRERARLAKEDSAVAQLSVLGPDENGQLWLVRKDKLAMEGA